MSPCHTASYAALGDDMQDRPTLNTTPDINKILKASPVSAARGAPMGAPSYLDNPEEPLYVQKVRMIDGDYTLAGVYFGGPPSLPLWCGFSVAGNNRVYVRGRNRGEAIEAILKDWPDTQIRGSFGRTLKERSA